MILPAALWVGCLAAAPLPQSPDPLLELVRLAELLSEAPRPPAESPLSGAAASRALATVEPLLRRGRYAEVAELLRHSPPDTGRAGPPARRPTRLTAAAAEREAVRRLQEGEPRLALEALRASGPEDRWPPQLALLAARANHTLGNEVEARALWLRVADAGDPTFAVEAGIAWARSAESAGDVEGALHRLAGLTGDARHGAEASYLAGRMELQHGQTNEAIASLSLAATKRRQRFSDEARWWLGWVHFGAGRFDQAIAEWKDLEKTWPSSPLIPQGVYWRARALDQEGKGKEAGAIRDRLPAIAAGSYYAVLAGRAVPQASEVNPDRCAPDRVDAGDPFWVAYRRAALLHGLGFSNFANAELEIAARKARGPAEAWVMAQLDEALGATGRAFSRANGSAAACIPSGWPSAPLFPRVEPSEVASAARAVGIDPFWLYSLMRRESRFEASARSPAGAVGLLQMLPVTGARIASVAGVALPDLGAPAESIWFAAWYLGALSERFAGDFALVAAAYDAGPDSVATWLSGDRRLDEFVEQIPFRETRAYVKEAVANLVAYHALYGSAGPEISADARLGATASSGVSF